MNVDEFIARWEPSQASERANKDSYLKELCRVLGVPEPDVKTGDPDRDTYVFEADARILSEEDKPRFGSMDLYKKGRFVLEAKQGSEKGSKKTGTAKRGTEGWAIAMTDAYGQALQYARTLEEPPPFIIVADLGYCFDLYACFDGTGAYRAYPNSQRNRLRHAELSRHVDVLRKIWIDPKELDPSRYAKRVTEAIANELAVLATELEQEHPHELVSKFLMRCVFTMFAEDIGLLPDKAFSKFMENVWIKDPTSFKDGVELLWRAMNTGETFYVLGKLLRFNGGLFAEPIALDLNERQIRILRTAANHDWAEVEPAIFGTLIERALNPNERHRLGAHFTPTEYVKRLLMPTIDEPVRSDWDKIRVAVRELVPPGEPAKTANVKKAVALVEDFRRQLCSITILDPACGSGNFLYVALHLLKEIESDVRSVLYDLGETQQPLGNDLSVTPRQFLGIEVRPGSRDIADLVLWIGYLQWHHKMYGGEKKPPEPILRDYKNIECRDAVLAWDGAPNKKPKLDEGGQPITRWDSETTKIDSVTGREVPDDRATISTYEYPNVKRAAWPSADFIVGNPPFIGGWLIRKAFGDGYVEALWKTYPHISEKADYVMYWWDRAAEAVRLGKTRRFGLITTNSITQVFQRRVVAAHLETKANPIRLLFAIADHPWVDSENAAAVRIAMTVGGLATETAAAQLGEVTAEEADYSSAKIALSTVESIGPELQCGAGTHSAQALISNDGLCSAGVQLYGSGFVVDEEKARQLGGPSTIVRRYLNGRDLVRASRDAYVIDFFGLDERQAASANPAAYQHVLTAVKPERDQNRRAAIRTKWWRFGWERPVLREATAGLKRFITTPETAKHRVFTWLDADVLPDNMLTNIAVDDAFFLGVLSSRVHVAWALAAGGTLEDRPRYTKTVCFDPFPFPVATDAQKRRIRDLAERLDAHRKKQLGLHPKLTITDMYNVLDKLRAGAAMTAKDKSIHEQGLVSILRQLHEQIDVAVLEAYGWPPALSDEQIIERLASLNAERVAEESRGQVRWIRRDFQKERVRSRLPGGITQSSPPAAQMEIPWPKDLPEQVAAVRDTLRAASGMLTANEVASAYRGASIKRVVQALRTLEALGDAASHQNGTLRWKGLAKVAGERGGEERKAS